MKKYASLGGLLAVLAALTGLMYLGIFYGHPAQAQQGFRVIESDGPAYSGSGGSSDSTTFTIFQRTDAQRVADTGPKDTTQWFGPMTSANLPQCQFAGQPLLKIELTNANAAAGDSIGYVVQYSFRTDKSVIFSKAKAYFAGAAPYAAVVLTCDTHANEAAGGAVWFRVIYSDEDQSNSSSFYSASSKWNSAVAR